MSLGPSSPYTLADAIIRTFNAQGEKCDDSGDTTKDDCAAALIMLPDDCDLGDGNGLSLQCLGPSTLIGSGNRRGGLRCVVGNAVFE